MGLNPNVILCQGTSANGAAAAQTALTTTINAAVVTAKAVPKVLLNQISIVYSGMLFDGTNYVATAAVYYNLDN